MIKFIDKDGNIFEGQLPYIHWLEGGQSVGLWYDLKLLVITDNSNTLLPLVCNGLNENSIFKFVRKDALEDIEFNTEPIDISDNSSVLTTFYNDPSINIINVNETPYRVFQIHILCKSNINGQITDTFKLSIGNESIDVCVGGDFYNEDEVLSINLGNKGMDIPPYVEKSFYDSNIQETNIDNILINRKFKELLSNYIDIIDCKGSYKSLINSLEWFDWGDNIKIYEIWKSTDKTYFEKNLELILSDIYKYILQTQSKTTYISLVTALQQTTADVDDEKNPILTNIIRKWSNEDLALKISILGAFFERYFMPIHMDLKRASVEAHIYTVQNKVLVGESIHNDNYLNDTSTIEINMPHEVILGNLDGVAVGDNTMFGRKIDFDHLEEFVDDIDIEHIYTFNFYNKNIEYWANKKEYNDVQLFLENYKDWATKWNKISDNFSWNGKLYQQWVPTTPVSNIVYALKENDELSNNFDYLNRHSVVFNIDNRYCPFKTFLVNVINDNDNYESGGYSREWIEGSSQSLVCVEKKEEKQTIIVPTTTEIYTDNFPLNSWNFEDFDSETQEYFNQLGYSQQKLSIMLWMWSMSTEIDPEFFSYTNGDTLPSEDEVLDNFNDYSTLNWANKFTNTNEIIEYEGNYYQLWKREGRRDTSYEYAIISEEKVNNPDLLKSKSLSDDLDNEWYNPFEAILNPDKEITYDKNDISTLVGAGRSLLLNIKSEDREKTVDIDFDKHTHYIPVGVDDIKNIVSEEKTKIHNIDQISTIYIDNFGQLDPDPVRSIQLRIWMMENNVTNEDAFNPEVDTLPSENECKEFLSHPNSWDSLPSKFVKDLENTTIEYDGEIYQLWKNVNAPGNAYVYGLLPIELANSYKFLQEFSLSYNLSNRYCPFTAFLADDGEVNYHEILGNKNHILVTVTPATSSSVTYKEDAATIPATTYGQLIGSVGVKVPITISVNLPEGDGINIEEIELYKNGIDNPPIQVVEKKLFMSNNGVATFSFNLVSTKLEEVSFSLTLHSISGHTWTAAAGYKVIDASGCQLDIYKIENVDYSNRPKNTAADYLELMNGNPWGTQYNTIQTIPYENEEEYIDPTKYLPQIITQYIPIPTNDLTQYNEYIIVNNPFTESYETDWATDIPVEKFWALPWGQDYKYTLLVAKKPGKFSNNSINDIIDIISSWYENDSLPKSVLIKKYINRHDYIFIPQLHKYTNLEDNVVNIEKNKETGKYDFGGYNLTTKDLLCVRPNLTFSVPVDLGSIRWEFKNMTTLQTIQYDIPISKPMIANNQYKSLDPGFWSVTMYFKLAGDGTEHKITKNSAFRIVR